MSDTGDGQAAGNSIFAMAQREKFWEEKSADEKIETLRSELAWAHQRIERYASVMEALLQHQHVGDRLMMPLIDAQNHAIGQSRPARFVPNSLRTKRERGE